MRSIRVGCVAASLIALCLWAPNASASRGFRPRIGPALGIVPAHGHQELAAGTNIPIVYHGGAVMRDVTIHAIFWAPTGFRFDGPVSAGGLSYEQLIERFFTDVAHDSGSTANVFSVLGQYPDGSGPGAYRISFQAGTDSIFDAQPYPAAGRQCASPSGVATCVTDLQLQQEIDRVIQARDPAGRGLHDLWFVFLPPDVDTCMAPGQCGSNVFGGYHSLSNLGRGPTIYAIVPDPLIAGPVGPGSDPQGNPEAESTINAAAHEAVEAITDPEGTGWMDPNGFEVGDKCAIPEVGTPLGFAPNGSPYNQVIDGDPFLVQAMWSNSGLGCRQRSASTSSALPLATVNVKQFSPFLSGNVGTPRGGISVTVRLFRAHQVVATGRTTTGPRGGWGPIALRAARTGRLQGVGDDRDEIVVRYGRRGPRPDLIRTGDGGDPFSQAGWTGWFDLDNGFAVGPTSVLLSPCSQTGVLGLTVNGASSPPPIEHCETESDVATVRTRPLHGGTALSISSEDNRAVTLANPDGALVKLTVPAGEPGSVSALGNGQILFGPTGFPSCTADLRAQAVGCTGLVPGARYALTRSRRPAVRRARADGGGTVRFEGFPGSRGVAGGDVLTLTNRARRTLTALHVARLRVDIKGEQTVLAAGRCEPADYYGLPLRSAPISAGTGIPGAAGAGAICPPSGDAAGLPAAHIVQVDDRSGGLTRTEVPQIESTAPIQDETLYGPFVALAQTGLPGPHGSVIATGARVALTITGPSGGRTLFASANVDTAGVAVAGLAPGPYLARWVLTDANGDTRTVMTHFVEATAG